MKRIIEKIAHYRFAIGGILFMFMVATQLHGLSLPAWDGWFPLDTPTWHLGQIRSITSDVWGIGIPQVFSQAQNGFPLYNTDLMTNGMNAVLAHLPTLDISVVVGQPAFWGYYLLGVGHGLAWFYWFRIIGIFLTGYCIIHYLTKDTSISLFGSILLATAPAVLWWGGHNLPEVLLYGQMILAGGICYVEHWDNWKYKIPAALMVMSATVGFVLMFYPALQVSLGIMVLIFAAGVIWEKRKTVRLTKTDAIVIASATAVAVFLIGRVLWLSKDAIALSTSTVFPGTRFETGGGGSWLSVFYSLFQWLLPFRDGVAFNNCEASMFIPVWPVVLIGVPLILFRKTEKLRPLTIGLYSYFLFCISWMLFIYPVWFARISLFSNVTWNRLIWTIGVLSIYLACILVAHVWNRPNSSIRCVIGINLVIGALALLAVQRGVEYSGFISDHRLVWIVIGIGCLLIGSVAIIMKSKRSLLAVLAILFACCSAVFTNPIVRGADAIENKALYATLKEIDAENPDAYWLFNGQFPFGNFLTASGLRTFNATNAYADFQKWNLIDDGRNSDIYNRYAQVNVQIGQATNFELLYLDQILVTLTPQDLKRLKVDYIVSVADLSGMNGELYVDLKEVTQINNIWIYQVAYK